MGLRIIFVSRYHFITQRHLTIITLLKSLSHKDFIITIILNLSKFIMSNYWLRKYPLSIHVIISIKSFFYFNQISLISVFDSKFPPTDFYEILKLQLFHLFHFINMINLSYWIFNEIKLIEKTSKTYVNFKIHKCLALNGF